MNSSATENTTKDTTSTAGDRPPYTSKWYRLSGSEEVEMWVEVYRDPETGKIIRMKVK